MPTRTARTAWDGGFEDGSGQVELTDSGLGTFEMSFKKRSSEDGGGATNPEELLGAAHSSCFTMQLTAVLGQKGATPISIETTAKVTLGEDSADGGFKISKIALRVRGEVEGIDEAGFLEAAEAAKVGCPLSKALASVPEITLDAALETA
ncbi:OsmC family peroxiredoxin [Aeromicrobium wangtongii]|uniref:OsmC family peroxiredoxin n=1 Tax=Aeromicrobium wangtongii TaxID=2969247 RepID=A0ABY5M3P9_9ACTN|nr:OsmC family peroxiredoxin [Aeromicrobium wangtongii]MCD9199152.1 OsmC family peroxiredoxin [Aeromicrobium wangtongii]MCL3820088.1 OsmC family peroxiredoxin [Aeromicrobium wangtongii]UUP12818.1 OsmC family peroxiredoxin [Aeromicrobium wangtongii]